MLNKIFFSREADIVAKDLLGKVIRMRYENYFLSAIIIETEAYFIHEKGSHSSLGFTEKRKALFMPPGTIYMYYARGGDSLNISCLGEGNAVLIKSAYPYIDKKSHPQMIEIMQKHNPLATRIRSIERLCNGQTLLCKSLGLKVPEWNQKQFVQNEFFIEDVGYHAKNIIQTKRLGIPVGRDEHLELRFIDEAYVNFCTKKIKQPGFPPAHIALRKK